MYRVVCFAALMMSGVLFAACAHAQPKPVSNSKSISFSAHVGKKSMRIATVKRREAVAVKIANRIEKSRPCSTAEAAIIARELGIRFQTVHSKKHVVKVAGYRQGRPASVKISRAPGCVVIE